jgi:uncharacterized protein
VDAGNLLLPETKDAVVQMAERLYEERNINLLVLSLPADGRVSEPDLQTRADRWLEVSATDLDDAALIFVDPNVTPSVAVALKGSARSVLSKYGTNNVYDVTQETAEPLEGAEYYSAVVTNLLDELGGRLLAEDTSIVGGSEGALVNDQADLFPDEREAELEARAAEIGATYGISVVLVTTPSTDGRTPRAYADDFYDYNDYLPDGILLLISMEPREVYISTTGTVMDTVTNTNVERILDDIFDKNNVSGGEYLGVAETFLYNTDRYMKAGPGGKIRELTLVEGVAPVVLAVIVALIMYSSVKKNYSKRKQGPSYDYRKMAKANYTVMTDRVVDKKVTSSRIERSGSGGGGRGGGGSHVGSSGTSHGGGGRSF